ncbi:MAG: hypothetical protein ACTHOE_07230 [Conexibacter sp.]
MRATATSQPPRRRAAAGGFPSFRLLEALSFVASAVFSGLLLFWLGPDVPAATMVLGWMHGLLWIGLSLLSIVAVRRGTIPFWLGVTVAVVGGIGPFAGTVGFLVESRRRKQAAAVA